LSRRRDVSEEGIKRALIALPDVQSCSVEFGREGSISAVHIVSSTRRQAKQLVRDIESVLLAGFGIKVDHRKISVARVSPVESQSRRALRPKFVSMKFSTAGGRATGEVVLRRGDIETTGKAGGVVAAGGSLRVLAGAAFKAVGDLVGGEAEFELLDVIKVRTGGCEAVVVLGSYASTREIRTLAGCVQYEGDEQRASVLAALDACNRIVEALPVIEHTEYEIVPFDDE
jgi:hypothetical protein